MPRSSACLIRGRLWSSGSVQVWLPRSGAPNDIQPRQIRETSRPVAPSLVYSMAGVLPRPARSVSLGPRTRRARRAVRRYGRFMPTRERVQELIDAVVGGDHAEAIARFYTDDASMQENAA